VKVKETRAILTTIEAIKIRLHQLKPLSDALHCPLCKAFTCENCPVYITLTCPQYIHLVTSIEKALWKQRVELEDILNPEKRGAKNVGRQ